MDGASTTRDWIAEVRRLPKHRIFVQHNPPTPRYGRAMAKLGYLLRTSTFLGVRPHGDHAGRLEIALWAPNPEGGRRGYYSCFRLFLENDDIAAAVLFCFYDGTEKSPALRTVVSALEYARLHGFRETP